MKLYYTPGACSLAPHIALEEAGATYQLVNVDLKTKKTESGEDFNSINGKGYIPALQLDDGTLITEGGVIAQYVADRYPASQLAPAAGTIARYQLMEWLSFIATELHKTMGSMFYPTQSPEWKAAAVAVLHKRLNWVVAQLEGKRFVMGDTFTLADGYLFNVLSWSDHVGFSLDDWPALQAYRARVAERPAVIRAMKAEGLL